MSKTERKIILVMVEGYSDLVSFERCIKAFFNTDEVRVRITYQIRLLQFKGIINRLGNL